ncbi:hypothetical protein HDU84_002336 [Entophlyctis sp. JEL0112]|nr:hypothetical protein HDU84_002336 [Entophlyctis sp. JEL0112]
MELRFYSPESRTKLTKRYVVKQNHQYIVDKKELDQLKELQTRELKHIKEYFDQRLFCTDEIFKLKSQQQDLVHQLAIKHFKELKEEKESLFLLKEESKVKQYDDLHQNQLRKILDRHRMQTENMIASHEQKNLTVDQSSEHYTKLLFSNIMNWSETNLTANSVCGSSHISLGSTVRNSLMDEARRSVASDTQSIGYTISEVRSSSDPIRVARERIKFLKDRQREIKATQVHDHLEELEQLQRHHQQKIAELKQQHEVEVFKLQKAHEKEIMELQIVHNREIEMEQSIHDAEEETLTERRILGSVLDSVVDGIIIIDTNAIVRRINFACENIFGYTSEEIVGQNVKILMPEYIAAKHDEIIANYLRTGVKSVIGVGRKLKGKRKNGELFSIHLSVTEVKQEEQHLFTGVIRDITNESIQEEMFEAQCKRDEELQVITLAAEKRRADEAEQSRKQQERYIDMICHEIRNPLNGIQNNNELLSDLFVDLVSCLEKKHTVIDERLQKMLDSAKEATTLIGLCAKHQKTIADDVLSMSKLNMNLIQISDSTPFDPTDIVHSSIETFRNDALKRGIEMSLETKNNLSQLLGEYPKLFGDPARLLQVLVQLISNAIKFTEKSEKKKVTIIADCIGSENGFVFLEFSVIDTGIGMTEEEQGLLFKQFSQESYKTYAEYGGSGLGLFIAKELTTLMIHKGGSISVSSKKAKGTTISFVIKVGKQPQSKTTNQSHASEKKQRILIVDDDRSNRQAMKSHLEKARFSSDELDNGEKAVRAFSENPDRYSLIFMDLEMPVMGGLEATQKIRAEEARLEGTHKPVAIVGVTGHVGLRTPERHGMQAVLLKPFTRDELLAQVTRHIAAARAPAPPHLQTQVHTQPSAPPSSQPQTIPSRLAALSRKRLCIASIGTSNTSHDDLVTLQCDSARIRPNDVAWSADARLFAVCASSPLHAVTIRSVLDGSVVEAIPSSIFESQSGPLSVTALAFGPRRGSRYLYIACANSVLVWDRKERRIGARYPGPNAVISAITVNVDETAVGVADRNGKLVVHSLKTNTPTMLRSSLTQAINKCSFSPFKKSVIVAVGDDGDVVLWDINISADPVFVIKQAHVAPIQGIAWSPCNKSLFATAGLDKKIHVFNKDENGKILLKLDAEAPITCITANDEFALAVGTITGKIIIFDVRSRKCIMSYQANNDGDTLSHLAFEPPQWAQETSQREQGGLNSAAGQNANHFGSKPPMKKPGVGANLPASGSPVVAAFKERMAAVKEKQSGLMDLFSPVKPSFRQDPVSRTGVVSDGERAASETFELSTPNLLNSKSAIDNTNASIALFSPMADRKTVSETNSPTDSVIAAEKAHGRYGGLGSSDPVSRLQSALQELKTQTPGHILVSTSSEIQRPRSPSISQPTKNLTIATGTKLSNTAAAESTLRDFGAAPLTGETPTEPDSALAFIMNTNTAGPSTPVPSVSSGGLANGWNEKVILKNLPGSPGHTAVPLVGIKLLPPPSARHPLASVTHASNDEVSGTSAKNEIATDSDSEFVVGEVDDEFNDPEGDAAAGNTSIIAGNFSEVVSVESNLRNDTVLSGDCDVDCDFWTCNEVVRTEPDQQDWKAGISIAESHEGIVNGGIGYEGVDDSGIQVVEGGVGNEGYAHKVLEAVLESCLDDFRKQVREEIQNMHVELLRQFCIQKKEMNDLFLAHSPTQELVKEVVRLREENARLRCGFK